MSPVCPHDSPHQTCPVFFPAPRLALFKRTLCRSAMGCSTGTVGLIQPYFPSDVIQKGIDSSSKNGDFIWKKCWFSALTINF